MLAPDCLIAITWECRQIGEKDVCVALDLNDRRDFKVYDQPFRLRLKCPTWSCGF